MERFDVLIIGAGLSGIDAAWHLQRLCPDKRYAILEAREAIGGTWDLFHYPGVRSDSDMFTLGYAHRPWRESDAIADGRSIRQYIRDTAREAGIDRHIRFGHRVTRASWSSRDTLWMVEAQVGGTDGMPGSVERVAARFLVWCSGYYRYSAGYTPDFVGLERFRGRVIHPQHWPERLDCTGKRIVVIGSGATAVTLVPALAKDAAHVTLLQRSPSYYISIPRHDIVAGLLRRLLPERMAYRLVRLKNSSLSLLLYQACRRFPGAMRKLLVGQVRRALGADYDVATHFSPTYRPWEQRLCVVPGGDLFEAIKGGRASVVTDRIAGFTENGLRLECGTQLEADIVVTATGLVLEPLGGAKLDVDGRPIELSRLFTYKGVLFSDVPNLASIFGYLNASWTLRADLLCAWLCRLLRYMDRHGYATVAPRNGDPAMATRPFVEGFSSGYLLRSLDAMPKQGSRRPWQAPQNYPLDWANLRLRPVADDALEFRRV
ncbi:MAG: NAD(P)/FAD-dependent oxidoreductase [Steroidobacteraceae bacterium]|jgi:cation diffusion facilitator CzcD-associated flavoprotein CzcO|nr:NAD(P)/FAD-dependent oxidoreductase [Steroidobacteraceae bacterium]